MLWAQLVLVCGSTRVDPLRDDGTVTTTGTGLTLLILLRQAWPRQLMARFSHRSFKSLFAKFFFTESGVHDAQDKIFLLLASRQIMIHGRQERCLTFPKQLGEEGAKFCFLALGALIIVFTHGQAVSRSVRITTISVLIRRWSRFRPLLFLVLLCSLPNVTQLSPPLSTQTPNTVAARTLDTRCKTVFFADLFHGCLPEPSKTIGMHLTVILMDNIMSTRETSRSPTYIHASRTRVDTLSRDSAWEDLRVLSAFEPPRDSWQRQVEKWISVIGRIQKCFGYSCLDTETGRFINRAWWIFLSGRRDILLALELLSSAEFPVK